MKKTLVVVLMLCVIVSGGFAQNAVIKELTGEVELKPAGAAAFVPAQTGDEVAPNTIVSTGFKSTAIIAVGSSEITVRPLTRLSLAEIQTASGSENLNMNLQSGRVKVDVKPPAGTRTNFTVQSPSATASVRGTSFEFDTRRLKVLEGKVTFRGNRGMAVLVAAGRESYVGKESKVANPSDIADSSLQPPPPPGSDSGGGSSTGGAPPSVDFGVNIQYDLGPRD